MARTGSGRVQLLQLGMGELHQHAVHLPIRRGNESGAGPDLKLEASNGGEANLDRLDPFILQQLPVHEKAVEENVEPPLVHDASCLGPRPGHAPSRNDGIAEVREQPCRQELGENSQPHRLVSGYP
jgi:hypothetical protein